MTNGVHGDDRVAVTGAKYQACGFAIRSATTGRALPRRSVRVT